MSPLPWSQNTYNTNETIEISVSGYDAITLAGLPSAFYLDANNLSGTINPLRLPTIGVPGIYTKSTIDVYGRVISGDALVASDIPSLDASKITTGVIASARLSGSYTNLASVTGTGICSFPIFQPPNPATVWDVSAGRIQNVNTRLQIVGIPAVEGGTRMIEFTGATLNHVVSASTSNKGIMFASLVNNVASPRWFVYSGPLSAETGSNVGSDFLIQRYDDTGVGLGAAFTITRSTGRVDIISSEQSTSTTTGALVTPGGVGAGGALFAQSLNGLLKLNSYTTVNRPVASVSAIGTIFFNTTLGKIQVITSATTIETITSA